MANGVNVPVKAGQSGGTELLRGTAQKAKVLRLAMSEGGDDNPFQALGVEPRAVFQIEGPSTGGDIRLEVNRILQKFEGKIEVNPDKPITVFTDPDRGFGVEFEWIDLETNERGDFSGFFEQPGVD